MKKFITCVLVSVCAVICAFGFTACGDSGNGGSGGFGGNGGNTGNERPNTVAVTEVTLNKNSLILETGGEETLSATVKPDNATDKTVSWKSDKTAVATVSDGKVTAVAEGTAIITATADGKSATCTVTVNKKTITGDTTPVANVTMDKSAITLDVGGEETLTATVKPDNATNKTLTWTSDKPQIATVVNGKVTAVAEGTAIITATADGKSATCSVTVNKATTQPDDTNVFAEIIEACKALAEKGGKSNVAVLSICQDTEGYFSFTVKADEGYFHFTTDVKIGNTAESLKSVNITALSNTELYTLSTFNRTYYNSDGTTEEQEIVSGIINKLLGNGYTVMFGTITATRDNVDDAKLGANASFTVRALLEKDGSVFEYSEVLTVSKSFNDKYGDVYHTFINIDEIKVNKDYVYKCGNNAPTEITCNILWINKEQQANPNTNKYAEIVTALQARVSETYSNSEILFIYEDENNLLCCKIKTENAIFSLRTRVSTDGHSLTAEAIDTSYYLSEISETRVSKISQNDICMYNTDGTDSDKQLVESMITKLLGDGYTVMFGTISATSNKGVDPVLGDTASFDVYALLEKDSRVFEYSETLTVAKGYGDVYQAVLNSAQANKDKVYKCNNNVPADLGELAKLYLAEEKRAVEAK